MTKKGLFWGTIGGGKVEETVKNHALKLLNKEIKTDFVKWNLQTDIGMTCGGEVSFFFEKFGRSEFEICVFGAGHVAQALVPQLLKIDCHVTCVDSREEWISRLPKHNRLTTKLVEDPSKIVHLLNNKTFIISMTQGHSFDVPILKEVFDQKEKFPFVGCIGSAQKAQAIKSDLEALGVNQQDLEHLQCPIGLPFGKNNPEEIAFSIIGQIITFRDEIF